MPEQLPDHLRAFDDVDKTRTLIYDNALGALKKRFPVEDDDYRLELKDPRYTGPQSFTMQQQKEALMKDRTLQTPITGTWRLVHKPTNQVIEEREDVVMHVPYYTPRGTFIRGSNEYASTSQARLMPGVYTRRQRTGDVETHFNVRPGTGKAMRLHLEPQTGIFKVNIGQSNIPAYPLMRALGVTDKQLTQTWGADLVSRNSTANATGAIDKLYSRIAGYKADPAATEDQKIRYMQEALPKAELDESVTGRTLGIAAKGITPEVLLRATQKMLHVSRHEDEPDDRDAPMFSRILGVEDLISERIEKDSGRLAENLLRKAKRSRSLKPVQRGVLSGYVDHYITGSGLVSPLEETNTMSTYEQLNRIVKMGEGGIGSAEAVTDEAKDVNPGQIGFTDPVSGPESGNIGIDVRAAYGSYKGTDGQLYGEFRNPHTGKMEFKTPADTHSMTLAFPGELKKKTDTVAALRNGKLIKVPKKEVDLEIPTLAHMFSSHINLNPMPTGMQGGRQFYASKYWSQYMPLKEGEVPLVDSLMDDGKTTFSEHYGRKVGTLSSPVDGTVVKVNGTAAVIRGADGTQHSVDLVKDFPFNRLTGISYFPTVEVGQKIAKGDMVAHSNFTDKKTGALTMGRNLKCLVAPMRGHSFEDAYTVSESAAKKLSTERLFSHDLDARHGIEMGLNKFISSFPEKYTKQQISNLDENGIAKVGSTVNKGDPLVLAVGPKLLTAQDAQLGKLHKVLRNARTDKSQVWEYDWPGVVTDANVLRSGARVNVKTTPPLATGDKLSTSYSIKGVINKPVPDDEMPRDPATNEPYEVVFNPMTIPSRVAPNQIVDISLAKLAKKTGKQIRLPQIAPEEGWAKWAKARLDEAGIPDSVDVFDPKSGKTIKNLGDGYIHLHAFHHLAEKKLSERGSIGGYTADDQPSRGGSTGSKRFSSLDVGAAIAHGATEVIRDVQTVRGTKNEEYWKALRSGKPLPEPGVPFIYNKFLNTLRAGGINVSEEGDITKIMPMTDKDVETLSRGKLESGESVGHDFEPVKGGLFDVGRAGGMGGSKWQHIELHEPIPNPIMEEPVRRLLGLTVKDMEAVLTGQKELNGKTGGAAMKDALGRIDIDAMIESNKSKVRSLRGSNRDNAIKILGYLASAKESGVHPSNWMISKVPVLPPMFRPVSRMGDVALSADMNELYRDIFESNDTLKELKRDLPDSALSNERLNVYNAVKAAYGLGEAITPEGQSRRLKGAVRQVIGDSPKTGMFHSKVISKPVDVVGRAVITPDANLNMDQVGIPEESAWTLYKDFVMRKLVHRGYPAVRASELIEQRDPHARELLVEEMGTRPVIIDRAPTWHKFNLMAAYPHIVEGNTMRVCPLISKAVAGDFDGDDQLNQVFFALDVQKVNDLVVKSLLPNRVDSRILDVMHKEHRIPILDERHNVYIADLSDFPHGELLNVVEGKNGTIEFFAALPGTMALALNEATGTPVWAEVSHFSRHPQRLVEVVTLTCGKQIYTDDDPRAVYGIDTAAAGLQFTRCTGMDALNGKVAVPYLRNGAGVFGTDIPDARITVTDKSCRFASLPMSWDIGYMLGALCGDGWWDKKDYRPTPKTDRNADKRESDYRNIYLADLQGFVGTKLFQVFQTHLDPATSVTPYKMEKRFCANRYGDTVRRTYQIKDSVILADFLSEHLGGDRDENTAGSGNKHLPAWVFMAPEACRRGMLCGLFDTDGTVCVTHGKDKPQLSIMFTSTSLRLAREVALLAKTLGITASVGFSKVTEAQNTAWYAYLSSPDTKRTNVFADLQTPGKRDNFINTDVDMEGTHGSGQYVVLPDSVSAILKTWIPAVTVDVKEADGTTREQRQESRNIYNLLWHGCKSKLVTRDTAGMVLKEISRLEQYAADDRTEAIKFLGAHQGTVTPRQVDVIRKGIRAVASAKGDRTLYRLAQTKYISGLNIPLKTGKLPASTATRILEFIEGNPVSMQVTANPLVQAWKECIVDNQVINWSTVERVEKTGKAEDGYDLTVPGYETFTATDGVILSNTMNFHVPASDKARDQAIEKMLPSKNLFSLTDLKSVRYSPTMEMTLGIYQLTREADNKKPVKVFASQEAAKAAYRRGEIRANDPVEIK